MLIKDVKAKLIGPLQKIEGVSTKNKPYLFYSAVFLDENYKTLKMNLSDELGKDEKLITRLATNKDATVTIDISLHQSGFNFRGTIVALSL